MVGKVLRNGRSDLFRFSLSELRFEGIRQSRAPSMSEPPEEVSYAGAEKSNEGMALKI